LGSIRRTGGAGRVGRDSLLQHGAAAALAAPAVTVVIAAYNEEAAIGRRVREFTERIAGEGLLGEVVVVSDGSTDATAALAREIANEGGAVPVTVVDLPANVGKAVALSAGCRAARHEIIALADARQSWAADALTRLLENFADPAVGARSAVSWSSRPGRA
jgi:poly-beta-1,6-N-acetyl-D-glucosamine synthase